MDQGFEDGTWHHVATIATGEGIVNYFDGVFQNEITSSTADYGGSDFNVNIGGGGVFDSIDANGNWFTGQIDEVAIFDKAIPAERIEAHFLAGKLGLGGPPPEEPPVFDPITLSDGQVTISWTGTGILEESDDVAGPYTESANQNNPQTVTPVGNKYYRLRQP